MRVVEPEKYKHAETKAKKAPKRRKARGVIWLFIAIAAIGLAGYAYLTTTIEETQTNSTADSTQEEDTQEVVTPEEYIVPTPTGELRQFSGNEFRLFYDNLLQPDLNPIGTPPEISGNIIADARIRQIAERRGYLLRANPSIDLPRVQGYQVHESAHQPWLDMQAEAVAAGHNMSIVSAFRSVADQRSIYLSRLSAQGVTIQDVADGTADEQVDAVLVTSSIPGYSKHHTGYTIDLVCSGFAFERFGDSGCFEWISANNYENAKKYGFIPSYPPDADIQGPDPEAWEYVYVGASLLTQ